MTLYIIETILFMLAAIGALLIGFDMLSNSITKIFHTQLKSLFNKNKNIHNIFTENCSKYIDFNKR